MTNQQIQLFNKILDTNQEANKAQEDKNFVLYFDKFTELHKLLDELKTDMGEDTYNKWMAMGKAMFAEKD